MCLNIANSAGTAAVTMAQIMDFEPGTMDGMFNDMDQDSELSQLSSCQCTTTFKSEYESDTMSVRQPSSPQSTVSELSEHSTVTLSTSGSNIASAWYTKNLQVPDYMA